MTDASGETSETKLGYEKNKMGNLIAFVKFYFKKS